MMMKSAYTDILMGATRSWTTTGVAKANIVHVKEQSGVCIAVQQKKRVPEQIRVNRVQLGRHPMTIDDASLVQQEQPVVAVLPRVPHAQQEHFRLPVKHNSVRFAPTASIRI